MNAYNRHSGTSRLTAKAVLRLIEQERRATARLAHIRADMRAHARRLCDAEGYRVILTGPALERLAIEKTRRVA